MRVLLIDDSPDDREVFRCALESAAEFEFIIAEAETGAEGLARLGADDFDCALLDYSLPDNEGLQVLGEVRLRFPELPVVMVTGEGSERIAVAALKAGAQDYVTKSDISEETLVEAIIHAIQLKEAERETVRRAYHDDLTGLPNRRLFNERLDVAIARSARAHAVFAVVFMDLDGFKEVNDTLGHDVGDLLLKEVSQRLSDCLRAGDTLARLGGDEFVAIVEGQAEEEQSLAANVSNRFCEAIAGRSILLDGHDIAIGVSLGIALYPSQAADRPGLLAQADKAMYEMKRSNGRR